MIASSASGREAVACAGGDDFVTPSCQSDPHER